ncbi:MAG: hypothetical protein MK226_08480 [Saprospiraceae bacterium]|nr:hypothetical protein [Saprospiraceae bacterium]
MKWNILILLALSILSWNCQEDQFGHQLDEVNDFHAYQIRLGDGVPINLALSIRWQINKPKVFYSQFVLPDSFSQKILYPRMMELTNEKASEFISIDSVFGKQRQSFTEKIKKHLLDNLAEEGILIKEVFLKEITFPSSYTQAMEQAGLQQQELERIKQKSIIALAQSEANKQKTDADAKVRIAQAESESRIAKIQAKTEENRRKSELAKAETTAQIAERQAEAEAKRLRLLAKAELEKKEDLKNLEIQKQKERTALEVEKQKLLNKVDFAKQLELAKVYQDNPVYASFVVNKELASKVEIAVLPSGSDPNVFGSFLKQGIKKEKNDE